MVAVAGSVLAFGTRFDEQHVMKDDEMTETAVVKTRLTPAEKEGRSQVPSATLLKGARTGDGFLEHF
ncbi:hypothetical protein, partial [Modicisalibacter tunisiensis]